MNVHVDIPPAITPQSAAAHGLGATAVGYTHAAGGAPPRQILSGIELDLVPGTFNVVTGPSGSGKTTLLCVLAGLLAPTQGTVTFAGQDLYARDEAALLRVRAERFGFIFQDFRLIPEMSVLENATLLQRFAGIRREEAEQRANALFEVLGIAHVAHSRIAALSGGERQRVAIARALMNHPQVIFADEPTAALDWRTGRAVVDMLKERTRSEGMIAFVVTHDHRVVEHADREIRLRDGQLEE
jgi:putative ABC transport system ATP-binding protein